MKKLKFILLLFRTSYSKNTKQLCGNVEVRYDKTADTKEKYTIHPFRGLGELIAQTIIANQSGCSKYIIHYDKVIEVSKTD